MKKYGSKKILTAILYSIALSCCLANTSSAGTGTGIGIGTGTTATAGSLSTTTSPRTSSQNGGYEIIRDKVVYSRWRSIISRLVKMPNGHEVDYDIVDQKGAGAALVFAWNTHTKTATIIKEYNPGCDKILYGIAAGIVETDIAKHGSDYDIAARHELEEETQLDGDTGTWYRLMNEDKSIAMDKYLVTEVVAYLVVDPVKVEERDVRPMDVEEDIEIVEGVTVVEILEMIRNGEMNCIGAFGCLLAIEKLRELGEI